MGEREKDETASFETRFQVALGVEIQERRLAAGLSQPDVAGRLGLHVKTYATYEQGIRAMTAPRLASIAWALGTGPDVLMRAALERARLDHKVCPTCGATSIVRRRR
jgi:transcriptional regulator with XRE-family HTH domain